MSMGEPQPRTLSELLTVRADTDGGGSAFYRVAEDGGVARTLTFTDLHDTAAAVAAGLDELAASGTRVVVVASDPLAFLEAYFGVLHAGMIPVPAAAPVTPAAKQRLMTQIADCAAVAVLGEYTDTAAVGSTLPGMPNWWSLEELRGSPGRLVRTSASHDVALLQYTSGSTGVPRGVVVTHEAMLANQKAIQVSFGHDSDTVMGTWLPLFHDMGLIGGMLQPLYLGVPCYAMTPSQFVHRPASWLEAIGRYKITTTGGPNFAYDLCVDQVPDDMRAGLDLKSWRVAFNGAEPIRAQTLARFAAAFEPAGFDRRALHPCYGMAEATLLISGSALLHEPMVVPKALTGSEPVALSAVTRQDVPAVHVSCGRPSRYMSVRIVDLVSATILPDGHEGEIWVAGDSVATHYWNMADDTHLVQLDGEPGKAFLRTGDLGFVAGGELYVTGRTKDLIIVHGRNVHPSDIEAAVAGVDAPPRHRVSAAFESSDLPGRIVVLVEGGPDPHPAAERARMIRSVVADLCGVHISVVGFLGRDRLPKTTSGKVRRAEAGRRFEAGEYARAVVDVDNSDPALSADAPQTVEEALDLLARLIQEYRHEPLPTDYASRSPIALGFDSLDATRLAMAVNRAVNAGLTAADVLGVVDLRALAVRTRRAAPAQPPSASASAVSPTVHAMHTLSRRFPQRSAENISVAFVVPGDVDMNACRRAVEQLVIRHPALRTSLTQTADGVDARVLENCDPWFDTEPTEEAALPTAVDRFASVPFDLARPPLLRVRVHEHDDRPVALQFVVHHAVADQWSVGVLVQEFWQLVDGVELAPPVLPVPVPHDDPSAPDNVAFWQATIAVPLGPAPLPGLAETDEPLAGRAIARSLTRADTDNVRSLAAQLGVTSVALLLAAYQVTLSLYTGRVRVVTTVPFSNRTLELDTAVGCYVNALPVVIDVVADQPFGDVVTEVAQRLAALHARQTSSVAPQLLGTSAPTDRSAALQFGFSPHRAIPGFDRSAVTIGLKGHHEQVRIGRRKLRPIPVETFEPVSDLLLAAAPLDDRLLSTIEYDGSRTCAAVATAIIDGWLDLLRMVGRRPDLVTRPISELDGRGTLRASAPSGATDVVTPFELCRRRHRDWPDAVALDSPVGGALRYGDLFALAGAVGALLRSRGVRSGDLVAVECPASTSVVAVLFGIWSIGAVYCPIDVDAPIQRRARLKERLATTMLVTDAEGLCAAAGGSQSPERDSHAAPDDPCYIISTSGSTGPPKGVTVPNRGLLNTISAQSMFGIRPGRRVLQMAPLGYDASIFEIVLALAHGGTLVFPAESVSSPEKLLWAARERRVDCIVAPPTLVAGVPPDAVPETLIVAGEPCPPALVRRLAQHCQLFNAYGPTECSIWASVEPLTEPDAPPLIGRPIGGMTFDVVDAALRTLPPFAPGQLLIRGPGVALGYLGDREATRARFVAVAGSSTPSYLTGDLVYALPDGRYFYLGRTDRQVKVHGVRIEPGEIETVLRDVPGVAAAEVVTVADAERSTRLYAFVRPEPGVVLDRSALRAVLRKELVSAAMPAALHILEQMPADPNGKVDRSALLALLTDPHGDARAQAAPSTTPTQRLIADLCGEMLGSRPDDIGADLFELGLHSLNATRLIGRLSERVGRPVPLALLFEYPVLADLASAVDAMLAEFVGDSAQSSDATTLPSGRLLPTQRDIWLHQQLMPDDGAYRMPLTFELRGPVEVSALTTAVADVIERHPNLRARITAETGDPQLVVDPPGAGEPLRVLDLSALPDPHATARDEVARIVAQPVDLAYGPQLHATLMRTAPERYVLSIVGHHIFMDGWSAGVLLTDLSSAYDARRAGRVPAHAVGLAVLPRPDPGVLADRVRAWQQLLDCYEPGEVYVSDASRCAAVGPSILVTGELLEAERSCVVAAAARHRTSPFVVLAALFAEIVGAQQGRDDVIVTVVHAGRDDPATQSIIDCAATALPLRVRLGDAADTAATVDALAAALRAATAIAGPSLSQIGARLAGKPDGSRSPLLAAMVTQVDATFHTLTLTGIELSPLPWRFGGPKAALLLEVSDCSDRIRLGLEADPALFGIDRVQRILDAVLDGARLAGDLGSDREPFAGVALREQELLEAFNRTECAYDRTAAVPELVAAAVDRLPSAVALRHAGVQITYAEFDMLVSQLANTLVSVGVDRGDPVGVFCAPGPNLVVAVHAVMRAGGAYVALDPAQPTARTAFAVADLGLRIVVTDLPGDAIGCLDAATAVHPLQPDASPDRQVVAVKLVDPAYILHTSGSSGRPKAVVNTHGGLLNRLLWMQDTFGLAEGDRVLQKTTFTFDVSVWELFWPLAVGATICTVVEGTHQDMPQLWQTLRTEEISVVHFVPSSFADFLRVPPLQLSSLRAVVLSGEAVTSHLLERAFGALSCEIHNLYGPTEAAIDVTHWRCMPDAIGDPVPIGRPIANTRIDIVDTRGRIAPIGAPGEIVISGAGVATGYLGRPDLTRDRFRPAPGPQAAPAYWTGDIGRWRVDGVIEFLGRIDDQIKLGGVRVEPGEVLAALRRRLGITDGVVTARGAGLGRHLVAVVVPGPGGLPPAPEIRRAVAVELPSALIPRHVISVSALPRLTNGKIDFSALPQPSTDRVGLVARREPQDGTEAMVLAVWCRVLERDDIGVTDNFFDVGGNSAVLLMLHSALAAELAWRGPIVQLLEASTVRDQARLLHEPQSAPTQMVTRPRDSSALRNLATLAGKRRSVGADPPGAQAQPWPPLTEGS